MSFTDIASQYLQNRWDQATQPFTDPQGYMDERFGNVKPRSTTISYDEEGKPASVTTKHDIGSSESTANAIPTQQPTVTAAPVAPAQIPQQQFAPYQVATAGRTPPPPQQAQVSAAPVAPAQPQAAPQTVEVPEAQSAPGPVAPEQVAQATPVQRPVQQPVAPVQAGAGEQPTGPAVPAQAQAQPQVQAQPQAQPGAQPIARPGSLDSVGQEKDLTKRASGYQKIMTDPNTSDEDRKFAAAGYIEAMQRQQQEAKAMRELQGMNTNDLARAIKKDTEEGSFIKYYLASRLGLHELAGKEADKLGYTNTRAAEMLPDGNKYYVERRKDGEVVSAMDSNGNYVGQDVLSKIATESLPTKGAKSEIVGQFFNKDLGIGGRAVTQQVGSQTKTYIESGGKLYPWTSAWTPQTQVSQEAVAGLKKKLQVDNAGAIAALSAGGRVASTYAAKHGGIQLGKDKDGNTIVLDSNGEPLIPNSNGDIEITPGEPTGTTPTQPANNQANVPAKATAQQPRETVSQIFQRLGIPVQEGVTGGRTRQDQANQVAQWYANGMKGPRPAEPGTSRHETGDAGDVPVKYRTAEMFAKLRAEGLNNPIPNEPWHFERPRTAGGKQTIAQVEQQEKLAEKRGEANIAVEKEKQLAPVKAAEKVAAVTAPVVANAGVAQNTIDNAQHAIDIIDSGKHNLGPYVAGTLGGGGPIGQAIGEQFNTEAARNTKAIMDTVRGIGATASQASIKGHLTNDQLKFITENKPNEKSDPAYVKSWLEKSIKSIQDAQKAAQAQVTEGGTAPNPVVEAPAAPVKPATKRYNPATKKFEEIK
jgi:hypothetical protein